MGSFFLRKFFNIFYIVTYCLLLIGCFPGFKEEKQQDKDREKIQKLESFYASYVGSYTGHLQTVDQEIPIIINMVQGRVQNGFYTDGAQKFLPIMNVSFKREDRPSIPTQLTGNISDPQAGAKTNGIFTLVQGPGLVNPNDLQIASIQGTFESTHFMGTVTTLQGQQLGTFDLLKGETQPAPSQGADEARYAESRISWNKIKGTYKGTLKTSLGFVPTKIRIFYDEVPVPNTLTHEPVLRATFRRTDVPSYDFVFGATYREDLQQINFNRDQVGPNPSLDFSIRSLDGKFGGDLTKLSGNAVQTNGVTLPFEVSKQDVDEVPPPDPKQIYKQELEEEYKTLTGTWYGHVDFKSKTFKDMDIQIDLVIEKTLIDGDPDFPRLIGNLFKMGDDPALVFKQNLIVTFDRTTVPPKITINGKSWKPTSPYYVNIYGTYSEDENGKNQKITGQWQDYQNNIVPLVLTRQKP